MRLLLVLVLGFAAHAAQAEEAYWAAYSYSPSDTAFFFSANEPTEARARDQARRSCNRPDCRVGIVVKNGCIALTTSYVASTGTYWRAFGRADRREDAERNSMDLCEKHSKSLCLLMDSFCTFGAPAEPEIETDKLAPLAEDHAWSKGVLKLLDTVTAFFLQKQANLSGPGALKLKEMEATGFLSIAKVQTALSDRDLRKLIRLARQMGYIKD